MLQRETRCQMIFSSSWSYNVDSRNVLVFLYSSIEALVEDGEFNGEHAKLSLGV